MIFLKSAFACKTKLLLDSARQNSCSCKTNPTQYSFRKADFLWEKHAFRKLSILVVWDLVDIPVGNPSVFGGLWWEVSSSRAARVGQEEEWNVSGGQTDAHWMDSEQEVCVFPLSLSLRITVVGNVTLMISAPSAFSDTLWFVIGNDSTHLFGLSPGFPPVSFIEKLQLSKQSLKEWFPLFVACTAEHEVQDSKALRF